MSVPGKQLHVYLFKNDKQTVTLYGGSGYATGTINIVLKLQKGETVYMKHHNNTETIYSSDNVYCKMKTRKYHTVVTVQKSNRKTENTTLSEQFCSLS
jgi:hypothetical protein